MLRQLIRLKVPAAPASSNAAAATTQRAKAHGKPSKRDLVLQEGYQWLNGPGKRFDVRSARNWLHPKRPFPKNPWFVPATPVGDGLRQEIYDLYKEDPAKWTPRQLALKYELSVVRIEAILRLKHLEKKQAADGFVLQQKFAREMESLMGVKSQEGLKIREHPQMFVQSPLMTDDASGGSGSDDQQPTAELSFQRRSDGNYILPLSGIISPPEKPVTVLEDKNPREVNSRWRFIIADIGKKQDTDHYRQILVRDHDGTLRTATRIERRAHLEQYPADSDAKRSRDHLWAI